MLQLQYNNGLIFIFDVDDWAILRKEHRIMGELVGNLNLIQTLPCKLLPEEVLLLQDKQIAVVVNAEFEINEETKCEHEEFEKELLVQQQIIYKNNRKRQLETMIDKIVAAKRKRGDDRTPEEILEEELQKSSHVTKDNIIWPILLKPLHKPEISTVPREAILESTSELKYRIYRDLWERGYYITTGHKFGGDFLVYLGDPLVYHAIFIVRCVLNPNESMHSSEVVAFGRLGTSVKKRSVLASLDNDKVSYITINWIDA